MDHTSDFGVLQQFVDNNSVHNYGLGYSGSGVSPVEMLSGSGEAEVCAKPSSSNNAHPTDKAAESSLLLDTASTAASGAVPC